MKKLLSIALFCIALVGCSTKKNVENEVNKIPETNSGIITFVKKIDSIPKSISRSIVDPTEEEAVKDFYDNYYNPLLNTVNTELGRNNIANDAYFKFDKAGNVLELGLKTDEGDSKAVQMLKFRTTENNIPVFMYDWNEMMKYVTKQDAGGHDNDTNNPNKKYYWYEGTDKKLNFTIDNGVYQKNDWNSSPEDRKLIFDGSGKIIGAKAGSNPSIPIDHSSFGLQNIVNENGEQVDFSIQDGSQWVAKYKDIQIKFNYSNNKIEVFNGDVYLGYARDAICSVIDNKLRVEQKNYDNNIYYIEIQYNSDKKIVSYKKLDSPYLVEKSYKYDSKYGVLSKSIEKIDGIVVDDYEIIYDDKNGYFNSFKMTNLYKNYSIWNNITKKYELSFKEENTTVVQLKYTRDANNGNIREVYTDLNLGEGQKITGTFVPKN